MHIECLDMSGSNLHNIGGDQIIVVGPVHFSLISIGEDLRTSHRVSIGPYAWTICIKVKRAVCRMSVL